MFQKFLVMPNRYYFFRNVAVQVVKAVVILVADQAAVVGVVVFAAVAVDRVVEPLASLVVVIHLHHAVKP